MSADLKLRAARPLWLAGRAYAAGELLRLDAERAADALDSGRCVLIDSADAAEVAAARKTRRARLIASMPRAADAELAGPWIHSGRF
jgi:hypothetical protein